MRKTSVIISALFVIFLFSCKKKDTCAVENTQVSNSFPVLGDTAVNAGDTIHLVAGEIKGINYSWTGPNNFTSNFRDIAVKAYNNTYSGPYTVTYTNEDGCINHTESKTVKINPPKTTCNPSPNTIDFGYQEAINGYYSGTQITANASDLDLTILFPSTPITGIYQVADLTYFADDLLSYQVQVYINAFYTYTAKVGEYVYVTVNNGKVTVKFCNLPFEYGSSPINCDASVTASL